MANITLNHVKDILKFNIVSSSVWKDAEGDSNTQGTKSYKIVKYNESLSNLSLRWAKNICSTT